MHGTTGFGRQTEPQTQSQNEEVTPRQFEQAFIHFRGHTVFREIDDRLEPFLAVPPPDEHHGQKSISWIRSARNALQLKTVDVAARMGISRQTYSDIELSERSGNVTLRTLKAAARAMDCELIYAIRPKENTLFARRLWTVAWPECLEHRWVRTRPPRFKAVALAAVVRDKIYETEFRMRQGWSERYNLPATRPRRTPKTVKRD